MGVAWGDVFYPDNPKRRDEVVRLTTRVYILMERNFEELNRLIDYLNKYLNVSPRIQRAFIDKEGTFKDNSDRFVGRVTEVQRAVADIDKDLAERIEPDLYREIKLPDTTFDKRLEKAKKAVTGIGYTVAGIALVGAITAGLFAGGLTAMSLLGTGVVAGIKISFLMLGVDMIAGAIIGAIERKKLEEAIRELENVLETFEPASNKFQRDIMYVKLSLECHVEDDNNIIKW